MTGLARCHRRWLLVGVAIVVLAAACERDGAEDDATDRDEDHEVGAGEGSEADEEARADDEARADEGDGDAGPPGGGLPDAGADGGFTYNVGVFKGPATANFWAYFNAPDTWTGYVLEPTSCALYDLPAPTFALAPELAAEDWPQARHDDDAWVVEVRLRDGLRWSDGEPLTAHDLAFTWDTIVDLELGGGWFGAYEPETLEAGITTGVTAVDDTTVRFEFSGEPGLATWPMGLGNAPIMPAHHWDEIVDEAQDAEALLEASGEGAPTCGPFTLDEVEPGAFAVAEANEHYALTGATVTHYADGSVEIDADDLEGRFGATDSQDDESLASYTVGPFAGEAHYEVSSDPSVAVGALVDGEVDVVLPGPGLGEAAEDALFEADTVETVANPTYGLHYLGFNLSHEPMADRAFRQAVATVVDREFITDTVMGGAAEPRYTFLPPANEGWYDEARAAEVADRWRYDDMGARVEAAQEVLADAGYTWDGAEPEAPEEEAIVRGEGLRDPQGEPVREVELAHPTAGYDPLRHTAGLHIADFVDQLGVPVDAQATEFGQLLDRVDPTDGPEHDLVILGFGLGSPAFPVFYEDFWTSASPVNNAAFAHEAYDEAAEAFARADELADARRVVWEELEPILHDEVPHLPLFANPAVEGYRPDRVAYPYTDVLGGLGAVHGQPELVREPSD
ncbi:ABC transporter substrate-binding protein [Egibacter rhizosphaerae]|uniref:ABC transporter substrate-binding protein n=1 Tax=Egibacter rhizosphaerae TaxID=1670831 RepID=A0A411YHI3_9ACTN|nr:ABC transporter substrate-binding protein [Egibacter rhizosphaerae]QBI20724.1 ABC transporter substrate-binding protein [Egibacter rhizosphaerae]